MEPLARVAMCRLHRAERLTPWHHDDDVCRVVECELCAAPMAVWRWHGTQLPAGHVEHMLRRLCDIARRELGELYVDDHVRNIPDHWHAHGRPRGGFFRHGIRRRSR